MTKDSETTYVPEWWYEDDGPEDDEDDEGWEECGMMPDGQCTLAGTEWCDWDCPRNKCS